MSCFNNYANLADIQRLRLAKAEMLLLNGDENEGLLLLAQNMKAKKIHKESYLLLARYHYDKKKFNKSFKTYYYLIRKIDSPHFTQALFNKDFKDNLKGYTPPKQEALQIYHEIGNKYYQLFNFEIYGKEFNHQVLLMAQKYLQICHYYKFKVGDTSLILGKISLLLKQHKDTINLSYQAKEVFKNKKDVKSKYLEAKLLFGEALIKDGFTQTGSVYLQSIYSHPSSSESLRQYASAYIDALSKSFSNFVFSFGPRYKTNIHQLTDQEISNFDLINANSEYGNTKALMNTLKINGLISRRFNSNWGNLISGEIKNEVSTSEVTRLADKRSVSLETEAYYDNLNQSLFKIRYAFRYQWKRGVREGKLSQSLTSHRIIPEYTFTRKEGLYKLGLSLKKQKKESKSNSETLLQLAFHPFWHTSYLSPTFFTSYGKVSEGDSNTASNLIYLSASNFNRFSKRWTIISSLSFEKKSNKNSFLGSNEISLSLISDYSLKWPKGLALNTSLLIKQRKFEDARHIAENEVSMALTYTF